MKKLSLLATAFALTRAPAAFATYNIKTELELPNSKPISGEVLVKENASATIAFGETYVMIGADEQTPETVMMKTQIFQMEKGTQKVVSRPIVIAKLGQPAEITSREKDGKLVYRLKLTPTKAR